MLQDEKRLNTFLTKQILKDLDARNLNGSYIYLAAWLLIGAGSGFYQENFRLYWLIAAVFILLAVSRITAYFYFRKFPLRSQWLRVKWDYFNVLMPPLAYSALLSLAFYGPPFEDIFLYILMTIFALLSAGTVNFAPNKNMSFAFVLTLTLLPFFVAVFFTDDRQLLGFMLALYAFYMLIQAVNLNKEYLLRLQQQYSLSQLNLKDSLTGIGNRRHFDEAIDSLWKAGLRSHATVTLLLIDIDHFKRVNDHFGHATGDQVIKGVADIIKATCKRETDVVTRIGGEEFAVLFDGGDPQDHESFAERIRAAIEVQEFETDLSKISVTVSLGVAFSKPTLTKKASEFFKIADRGLYTAKDNGRNQIVVNNY
jgi:diguanylate cyclase (GGDEF)-like protein